MSKQIPTPEQINAMKFAALKAFAEKNDITPDGRDTNAYKYAILKWAEQKQKVPANQEAEKADEAVAAEDAPENSEAEKADEAEEEVDEKKTAHLESMRLSNLMRIHLKDSKVVKWSDLLKITKGISFAQYVKLVKKGDSVATRLWLASWFKHKL